MCGEPSSFSVRHRKLWCQRHHGSPPEQGTGRGVVGQTQVSKMDWDFIFFSNFKLYCTSMFLFCFVCFLHCRIHKDIILYYSLFQSICPNSIWIRQKWIHFLDIIKKLFIISQSISLLCLVMKEQLHLFRHKDRDIHFYTSRWPPIGGHALQAQVMSQRCDSHFICTLNHLQLHLKIGFYFGKVRKLGTVSAAEIYESGWGRVGSLVQHFIKK